jgi:DNA-binding winged helix-turn-helix (wHTH) protein
VILIPQWRHSFAARLLRLVRVSLNCHRCPHWTLTTSPAKSFVHTAELFRKEQQGCFRSFVFEATKRRRKQPADGLFAFEASGWETAMATSSEVVRRLRALSMYVATLQTAVQRCTSEVDSLLELATRLDQHSPQPNPPRQPLCVGPFIVDRATFSVSDGIHVCELGNTICFRFIECLASEPARRFTRSQLLDAVWDGHRRAPTTVRSAVFELRDRFRRAGMDELANAIRAEGGTYSLRIDNEWRTSQRKSNA